MSLFNASTNVSVISPQEAYQAMTASDQYVLLDVRNNSEYQEARIAGAKLIPVGELHHRAPAELPDKHISIFVYCRSGARAAQAVKLLAGMGYAKVYNIGGITNWPYETVKG